MDYNISISNITKTWEYFTADPGKIKNKTYKIYGLTPYLCKKHLVIAPCANHQKKKKFFDLNYTKYNKKKKTWVYFTADPGKSKQKIMDKKTNTVFMIYFDME